MTLGERIRKYREEVKMTQSELGEKLGLQKSAISMYENDKRTPSTDTLIDLCFALGIGLAELLDVDASLCQDPLLKDLNKEEREDVEKFVENLRLKRK